MKKNIKIILKGLKDSNTCISFQDLKRILQKESEAELISMYALKINKGLFATLEVDNLLYTLLIEGEDTFFIKEIY